MMTTADMTTTTNAEATTTTVTTMTLEMRAVNGCEQAVVQETIEVPYDANDL